MRFDDDRGPEMERMLRAVDLDFADTARQTGIAQWSERVRAAFEAVPRHRFVPAGLDDEAYDNRPLPIGHGQTISQPFIVALMSELLATEPDHVVLEIGTGCGYQTAVLARLVQRVHSIEIVPELAEAARVRLDELGVQNVALHVGDGHLGWPPASPYDGIVVTAAPPAVPPRLLEQLRPGARLVVPLGGRYDAQDLYVLHKRADGSVHSDRKLAVQFVPMTGGP
jgi:protein-L-isoaspartate(D-aspartate) O-methyltransferase